MEIDLIIFDCDGVLFDSKNANIKYYSKIISFFDREPITEEEIEYIHCHTAVESIKYLFRDKPKLINLALEKALTVDYSDFLKYLELEPGWQDLILTYRPPIKTAISTNRSTTMPKLIDIFELNKWFDLIVCALDVKNPKPDPESVFVILDKLNVKKDRAIYIGDSHIDEEIAKNADIKFISYKNPNLNADIYIDSFYQLKEKIGSFQ